MKTRMFFLIALVVSIALLAAACSTGVPKQTQLMKDVGVEDVTTRELRMIAYGFGAHCAGVVELAAQTIQDSTDSPVVRENAILWKMNAVPVIYQAAFTADPLGAITSMWAFCVEMRVLFTTGAAGDAFGEWQDIAVKASKDLEAGAAAVAASVLPDEYMARLETGLVAYAEKRPFDSLHFVRKGGNIEFLKAIAGSSSGGLVAAASMSEEMKALSDRMNIFTVTIPRQVQWQNELIAVRLAALVDAKADSALALFTTESGTILDPLLMFMTRERDLMMAYLSDERSAVIEGIATERIAALESLAEERTAVLEHLTSERSMMMEQINVMTLASIKQMLDESQELSESAIDHLFWRVLQLLALPFIILLALSVVVLVMIRNGIRRYVDTVEAAGRNKLT